MRYYYKDQNGNLYSLKEEREGLIPITEEEFNSLKPQEIVPTEEQMQEISKQQQINSLKAQLQATDYKAIKYAEGWISEEEYALIKAQRQSLRDQINELENN